MSPADGPDLTVGILGAGKLGTVLAKLALAAGHRVRIAGSGDPKYIALTVSVFAPGAAPVTAADAVAGADVVILAVPLHRVSQLDASQLAGVVTIDATNHWEPVDGPLPEFTDDPRGTSAVVQDLMPGARLVKAFSHVGYHDLDEMAAGRHDGRRIALGIASDDPAAADAVAGFVESLGFDAVQVGSLVHGLALQGRAPAFGATLTRTELIEAAESCDEVVAGANPATT